jgi:hypothetical protein
MLIKNFYNLYGGLSKTKKSLKKNRYKDYLTYLFAYLFLLLFIFYSIKDTLAAIEKTADKQYQNQKVLNIVLKQCNVLKEIEECKFSKKKFYKVQNNLIIFYDANEKVFSSLELSIPYSQTSLFKIGRIHLLNKKNIKNNFVGVVV